MFPAAATFPATPAGTAAGMYRAYMRRRGACDRPRDILILRRMGRSDSDALCDDDALPDDEIDDDALPDDDALDADDDAPNDDDDPKPPDALA